MSDKNKYQENFISDSISGLNTDEIKRIIKEHELELVRLKNLLKLDQKANSTDENDLTPNQVFSFEDLEIGFSGSIFQQAFFNQIPFMIWAKDLEGRFINANQGFASAFGKSVEDIIGCTDYDLLPSDFAEKYRADDNLVITLKERKTFEELIPLKDGFRWHETLKIPMIGLDGKVIGSAGLARDITRRKNNEIAIKEFGEKVQKFQSQQKAILDNIPHLAWLKDMNGKYLMVNEAFCRFFSWKIEDILGKTDFDLCPKELAEDYVKKDREVSRQRRTLRFFEVEDTISGKRYSETHKTPVINEQDEVIGVAGISRDITEQKIAEQALHKSEEKYKDLVTLLPEIVFETNIFGRITFANLRAFEQFGYIQEDFDQGISVFDLICKKDRERVKRAINKAREGSEIKAAEYNMLTKDGFEFPALLYTNNMYNNGIWSGLRGAMVDITTRKLAEEKEKIYLEKLRFLSNTALDFLSQMQNEDIYSYIGFKLKEFIIEGYVMVSSFNETDHTIELEYFSGDAEIRETIKNQTGIAFENLILSISPESKENLIEKAEHLVELANGVFDLSFGLIPIEICQKVEHILQLKKIFGLSLLRGGKLYGTIVIITSKEDIDDKPLIETFIYQSSIALHRRQLEQELISEKLKAEESDKLKMAFLANMSHEIRTPMNGIIGISQLLTRQEVSEKERNAYLEMINSNGNVLLNLVNDIIDISKIESNQVDLYETEFSLNKLFNDLNCFILAEKMVKSKDSVELLVSLGESDEESYIFSDKQKLHQILTNLISNAIKFTLSGEVEFGYSVIDNKHIEFFVKDTGIGIPEDKIDLIFNRFIQADQSLTRPFGGSGLGLAISKGFVEIMNGKIWAELRPTGGSCFRFQIPYKQAQPNIKQNFKENSNDNEYNWSDYTILVVEDNFMSFKLLQAVLKKSKVKIIHADNGQKAIDMINEHPEINLVLMDIQLPLMNGYEATKEIKKIRPKLPVIAQTANVMDDDKLKCINSGCSDYITKPIVFEKFLELVNNYIRETY